MSGIGNAMRRREDEATRPHERIHERAQRRTTDVIARGAPLERRVAFAEGAHALMGAAPLTMTRTTALAPQLARTAPLRALPRTSALAQGGYAASVAAVASPRSPVAVAPPLNPASDQSTAAGRLDLWLQAALYVALNLGDVISTYLGLRHGLSEGNPMMRMLLSHDGFGALIAYKIAITVVVLMGLWLLGVWSVRAARVALLICNTLVALVVILNFAQFALPGR